MKDTVAALTRLVELQGQQIVELSKALAIAHEHHAQQPASTPGIPTAAVHGRLWTTEEEEDELFDSGELLHKDTETSLQEILQAAGLDPNITAQ